MKFGDRHVEITLDRRRDADAALTSHAGASPLGGFAAPATLSRADTRPPLTSSIGSIRATGAEGLQLRTRMEHAKKPIDSDGGGPGDPPNKPKGDGSKPYHQRPQTEGHYGPWGNWVADPPLACRGRPGGC